MAQHGKQRSSVCATPHCVSVLPPLLLLVLLLLLCCCCAAHVPLIEEH
jgi:hypothetical protein